MDKAGASKTYIFGDRSSSDIIVRLRNREGRPDLFYCHSSILSRKSKYFEDRISRFDLTKCIEVQCSEFNYDHYVKLLKLLYVCSDLLVDSWDSIRTALGVLQAASFLHCEEITQSCIQYLEAVPWEDKEEEILKAVSGLGSLAMPILARIQPVDLDATKNVLLSAIRVATSPSGSYPPFTDELKTSAQEQVEYMLAEDEDTPLVTADDEVKSGVKLGLSKSLLDFTKVLNTLLLDTDPSSQVAENEVLNSLLNLEWMCNILPKMDLLTDFVSGWVENSDYVLAVVQDKKFDSAIWGVKIKLIEVTEKVFEAVGYGNVILPAPSRVQLLKVWLPFIRKMKPLFDSKGIEELGFPYKMDHDLCQSIEGAIISLVLALPSNDQADILADWMQTEQLRYPDLSEAFEVWCYRTKSAKRRLVVGFDSAANTTVSL
ncbi:hypothetical protein ACHQM5_000099 [Ranunculus cassubicifolius]